MSIIQGPKDLIRYWSSFHHLSPVCCIVLIKPQQREQAPLRAVWRKQHRRAFRPYVLRLYTSLTLKGHIRICKHKTQKEGPLPTGEVSQHFALEKKQSDMLRVAAVDKDNARPKPPNTENLHELATAPVIQLCSSCHSHIKTLCTCFTKTQEYRRQCKCKQCSCMRKTLKRTKS